jgi:hypothetical protein
MNIHNSFHPPKNSTNVAVEVLTHPHTNLSNDMCRKDGHHITKSLDEFPKKKLKIGGFGDSNIWVCDTHYAH